MNRRGSSAILVGVALVMVLVVLPIALIDWPLAIPIRVYDRVPTPPPRTPWRVALNEPYRVGGDMLAPVLVSHAKGGRSAQAITSTTRGIVILEVIVDAKGGVRSPKVLKGVSANLDLAATQAVRRWRYRPATLRGRPIEVYLTVAVPSE